MLITKFIKLMTSGCKHKYCWHTIIKHLSRVYVKKKLGWPFVEISSEPKDQLRRHYTNSNNICVIALETNTIIIIKFKKKNIL